MSTKTERKLQRAEKEIERLQNAIRDYLEPLEEEDWTTEDQMLKEVLEESEEKYDFGE